MISVFTAVYAFILFQAYNKPPSEELTALLQEKGTLSKVWRIVTENCAWIVFLRVLFYFLFPHIEGTNGTVKFLPVWILLDLDKYEILSPMSQEQNMGFLALCSLVILINS